MDVCEEVRNAFTELAEIDDDELRSGVVSAWVIALEENNIPDLSSIPWLGPYQAKIGISDELLVDHIQDVTATAVEIAEVFIERRGMDIDLNTILAGALVHDVSQLGEIDGESWTKTGRLLGHPYYGVYITRAAGLPVEVQHIVLSHTVATDVEPATLEAEIVRQADRATASAIKARVYDDLRDAPPAGPHT